TSASGAICSAMHCGYSGVGTTALMPSSCCSSVLPPSISGACTRPSEALPALDQRWVGLALENAMLAQGQAERSKSTLERLIVHADKPRIDLATGQLGRNTDALQQTQAAAQQHDGLAVAI